MSFLISLLVAFAIGFTGHATPAEQPVKAPVTAQQVIEAPKVDPILAMDAEATLDDHGVERIVTVKGFKMIATYVESDVSSDSLPGEFTFESIDFPGTFHHYRFDSLKDA